MATNFAYATGSNRLMSTSGGMVATYGYNANGNTTTVNSLSTYTYDVFNRLANASGAAFLISAEDQRLRKTFGGNTTYFIPDTSGALLAENLNGTWRNYMWLNGRLVTIVANSKVYPVHADQTSRPMAVTDPVTKSVLWGSKNNPFDCSVTQNTWGAMNIGFPGQYQDTEDNLWHNGFRDYDARTGRYIQSDPIGLAGGVNTYAYVGGNPISFVDPLGIELCQATLPGLGDTHLDTGFQPAVQSWIDLNVAAGVNVTFTSAFRSTASQGGLNNSNAITPARAGNSLHEAGYAVDISWNSLTQAQRNTVATNATTSGLSWGGNFRTPDSVHFYNDPGNRAQLIQDAQQRYQNGTADACTCD